MNLAKREAINYWRSKDLRRFLIASTKANAAGKPLSETIIEERR
jgi:hypothetical protein